MSSLSLASRSSIPPVAASENGDRTVVTFTAAELISPETRPGADEPASAEASSLNLPGPKLAAEQVRHRTELVRAHSKANGEAIELADIRKNATVTSTSINADVESGGNVQARAQPAQEEAIATTDPAREAEYRRKSLLHFVALCWSLFVNGWHDASTGPMLPRIQEKYNIGFAIVSLLFVCNAVGFLSGAFMNVYLTDRLGFGKVLVLGAVCQIGAYVMIVPAGPFPVLCASYLLIGITLAIQAAQATGFVAVLRKNSREKLSMLHGTYGLGALISPLVATHFAQDPEHWSFHFIISAGLYVTNAAVLWAVFRGRRQEAVMEEEGESAAQDDAGSDKFKQMMRIKSVHALSFFALIYVGIEVTLGGWSVTYILEKRGGSSNSGYISSGFFGGIMLGRFILMWLNRKLGERRALFLYAILTIGLEVTVWVVPSLIENAVAVSFVGLLLGPMFPILMNHSTTILPRWLMTACSGYIAGAGQAGSAVLPFITGLLAQKFGIASLQPFVVSMMSCLIVLWAVIPRARYVPT